MNVKIDRGESVRADNGKYIAEYVPLKYLQVEDVEQNGHQRAEDAVDRIEADKAERADELAAYILRAGGQHIQVNQPLVIQQGTACAERGFIMNQAERGVERQGDRY